MLLLILLLLPIVLGTVALLFVPAKSMKIAALVIALLDLALAIFAAVTFDWSGSTQTLTMFGKEVTTSFQHHFHFPWPLLEKFEIALTLGVDHLGMLMVLLTTGLGVIAVLCSFSAIQSREKEFYFFLLALQTGIIGVFTTLDLFLFFMSFELMTLPMYFLIGIFGSKNRIYATTKFFVYSLVGALGMFLSIIWVYFNGANTFSLEILLNSDLGAGFRTADLAFLGMMLAFLVKAPLWPFHTWLPDAHTEAPTAGSVILAGVLLKAGIYGMLRFAIPLFPDSAVAYAPLFTWLSIIAIIYGAMTAMVQTDIKKLVAYSSVSHMGFIILGIFSFNGPAISGAIIQMVNHGISTGGLFLAVGMIYERRHTREMSEFGGLARNLPVFAALTMVMVLSSVGLPGLNGFVGEFPILIGSMNNVPILNIAQDPASIYNAWGMANYTWVVAALAATGVIFGAVYLLIMYQKVFFGKLENEKNMNLPDLNFREVFELSVLAVAALVIGLFPNILLKPINKSTNEVLGYVAEPLNIESNETSIAEYKEYRQSEGFGLIEHHGSDHDSHDGHGDSHDNNEGHDNHHDGSHTDDSDSHSSLINENENESSI